MAYTSSSECSEEEYLCEYEKERLKCIKENQEMLKFLGIGLGPGSGVARIKHVVGHQ